MLVAAPAHRFVSSALLCPGLWGHAGAYLVCDVALAFIAFGVQFTDCPPVAL